MPARGDKRERIDDCLAKAEATAAELRSWLDERGRFFAREFARESFGADGAAVGFLTLVVHEYATHLAEQGACSVAVTGDGVELSR